MHGCLTDVWMDGLLDKKMEGWLDGGRAVAMARWSDGWLDK